MPRHGTYSSYKRGCRCTPCRDARLAYERHRTRHQAYGTWNPWGDIDATRVHITYLLDANWNYHSIADAAGVETNTVRDIHLHHRANIRPDTETKIRSVTPRNRVGYIPAAGTIRRLQALAVQGHVLPVIAAAAHTRASTLSEIRTGMRQHVQAATARRIAAAYTQLRHTTPNTAFAHLVRRDALNAGWHPHEAWNRHTIDDPGARPLTTAHAA